MQRAFAEKIEIRVDHICEKADGTLQFAETDMRAENQTVHVNSRRCDPVRKSKTAGLQEDNVRAT